MGVVDDVVEVFSGSSNVGSRKAIIVETGYRLEVISRVKGEVLKAARLKSKISIMILKKKHDD